MKTWRDIVAEMRKQAYAWRQRRVPNFCELSDHWSIMSDRIEEACKTLEDVLIVEQDENAKLRRALEPVMRVNADKILSSNVDATMLLSSIVKEAQEIMKGDAK